MYEAGLDCTLAAFVLYKESNSVDILIRCGLAFIKQRIPKRQRVSDAAYEL
jgi:hypothetical protein